MKRTSLLLLAALAVLGCHHGGNNGDDCNYGGGSWAGRGANRGPGADRPFPLGQVTDSFWETQQTNAEAADFLFYDHEFKFDTRARQDTADLTPGGKKHLQQIALRLEHVPFPVVIEQSPHDSRPELDQARRRTIVEQLGRLGLPNAEERVVVAGAFPEGYTGIESENSYYNILSNTFSGGAGRRFGGSGGFYR
jgi:hypothetical protein